MHSCPLSITCSTTGLPVSLVRRGRRVCCCLCEHNPLNTFQMGAQLDVTVIMRTAFVHLLGRVHAKSPAFPLQVVENGDGGTSGTLLASLDHCKTVMGCACRLHTALLAESCMACQA